MEDGSTFGNPPEDFDPFAFDGIQKIGLEAIRLRRAAGADGSLPMMDGAINGVFRGKQLDDDQIMGQLFPVLIGGVETLPKITAHGLWELAKARCLTLSLVTARRPPSGRPARNWS